MGEAQVNHKSELIRCSTFKNTETTQASLISLPYIFIKTARFMVNQHELLSSPQTKYSPAD